MDAEAELTQKLKHQLWEKLSQNAFVLLKETPVFERSSRVLRFGISPAFSNPRVWEIYWDYPNQLYFAHQSTWEMEKDWAYTEPLLNDKISRLRYRLGKLEEPQPTISRNQFSLEKEKIEALLLCFSTLSIPLSPRQPDSMGLDGVTYTLELDTSMWKTKLTWWFDQPVEWQALHRLARELLEFLGDDYDN